MKYLSNPGGRWIYIIICLFLILGAILGLLKYIVNRESISLATSFIFIIVIYLAFKSSYSTISYDRRSIYVQNLKYSRTYKVNELKEIKLINNSFRLFSISFKDGNQYKFVIGSPRIINVVNLSDEPDKMKKEMVNYMASSID